MWLWRTLLYSLLVAIHCQASPYGPKYPITASWFRDRFSYQEWNRTLAAFEEQGGDTVFLRAPRIIKRTREELQRDADFTWCGSSNSSTGATGATCYDEAVQELRSMGLNVTALVTYTYEEGFSDAIMMCPEVDRKVNSSRIYYRIVMPAAEFNQSKPCDFPKGSDVVVLLTSFAGTDPHALALEAAAHRNMSVFFGLPGAPLHVDSNPQLAASTTNQSGEDKDQDDVFDKSLMEAYYGWVYRALAEHHSRYNKVKISCPPAQKTTSIYEKSLAGYYDADECCLAEVDGNSPYIALYTRLGKLVHAHAGIKLAVSPSINLNRNQLNATVQQHVQGFEAIANTGQVDIIAVQEGRGDGKGCYFWSRQQHLAVRQVDPTLHRVMRYLHPDLKDNVTFQEACTASNQQVFRALEQSRDGLQRYRKVQCDLWLSVQAFEYLRDDPCLPVDPAASGMGQLLNRASKARVDWALAVASGKVQKVISFAWDSDFTCTTNKYRTTLAAEIRATADRVLITNCSFHSPANMSIVVIGYNIEGIQQGFEINWPARGKRQVSHLSGYYFELDWGARHNRVPSLEYTQLYDLPNVLGALDSKGWVSVRASGSAANLCIFEYDFTTGSRFLPRRRQRR